jgi:hypothetical protein
LNHSLAPEDVKLIHYRMKRALARLEGLSEAKASVPLSDRADVTRPAAGSSPPPMARLDPTNGDRPPSRDLSLYEHYRWRFDRARGDLEKIELLCLLAERDYWETAKSRGRSQRPAREIMEERNRRIIADYEGIAAIEVAVFERLSRSSIRKVRKEFGRDPERGVRGQAA